MPRERFSWAKLPDEELLEVRLKDLKLTIEGTWLEDCLLSLHDELALAGLRVPVLFHAHSCVANPVVRGIAGEALRRLRASLVACCRFVAESWESFVPSERVSVVFNGVAGPPPAAPG